MFRNILFKVVPAALSAGLYLTAGAAAGAQQLPQPKPTTAKGCVGCHQAEPNTLKGDFDSVAFKAKTIQMRIDDSVELIKFDEDEVKVVTSEGKSGDGDYLHQTKKGQELKIEYTEKDGVKTALRIVEKPVVKVAPEMLISTAELEKLIAKGPAKGGYFLFDSRPEQRFQEGALPSAVNLPYPSFDTRVAKLPADKNALIVFYCAGLTCSMSPASANKAKNLGYTNIKVYREGIPAWSRNNYTVLSARALHEAWIGQGMPFVLLDLRSTQAAARGFIKGAVSFPAGRAGKLIGGLPAKEQKPPVILYDAKGGKDAERVARLLLKAGYDDVKILLGGFDAWKEANLATATGRLSGRAGYLPKPRPGEIDLEQFRKDAAKLPDGVIIIDVRNRDEVKTGMLKSARNIPTEEIKGRMAEIPKDKTIVTQCSTGVRAEMAYHALKELGFPSVAFLNATVTFGKDGSYTIVKK